MEPDKRNGATINMEWAGKVAVKVTQSKHFSAGDVKPGQRGWADQVYAMGQGQADDRLKPVLRGASCVVIGVEVDVFGGQVAGVEADAAWAGLEVDLD